MLYALYKCIDVREIQKGKSMKRKKSTQLLAVASVIYEKSAESGKIPDRAGKEAG